MQINGLPSEICGREDWKIWNACCHQETLEQDNIETNKLRTRRLGNKGMRISCFLAVFRFFEVKKWPLRVQCEFRGWGGRYDDRDRPKYELW